MTRLEFTKAIKRAAFRRAKGKCERCSAPVSDGNTKYLYEPPDYHHDKECTFGGDNTLENCVVLCKTCHGHLTSARAPVIAKSNRARDDAQGIKSRRSRSFATNKDGPFKKTFNYGTVRR